jgi:hypothetical protein
MKLKPNKIMNDRGSGEVRLVCEGFISIPGIGELEIRRQ